MATINRHKVHGWRIKYNLYTQAEIMECEKYRKTQEQAYVFLKEAERFEFFTKQGMYTDEDVRRAMNFRVLSEEEASKFLKTKAEGLILRRSKGPAPAGKREKGHLWILL